MHADIFLLLFFGLTSILLSLAIAINLSMARYLMITPLLLLVVFHVVFNQIGSLVFSYDPRFVSHIVGYSDMKESQFRYGFYMSIVPIFICLGAVIVNLIFSHGRKKKLLTYQDDMVCNDYTYRKEKIIYLTVVLSLFIFVSVTYYLKVGGVPILNGIDSLASYREEINYSSGIPGWLTQVNRFVIPSLSLILYFSCKYRLRWFFLILPVAFLVANGERMPLVMYLLSCLICFSHSQGSKLRVRQIFIFVSAILCFIALFTVLLGRTEDGASVFDVILAVLHRIFISQSQTGSYIFQLFGTSDSAFYGWGIYLQNISTYFTDTKSFSVDLFYLVHSRSGSASHSAFSEAYASFGSPGIIAVSLILGAISEIVLFCQLSMRKNVKNIVTFSLVHMSISMLALGSLTGLVYNGLASAVLVFMILSVFNISFSHKFKL